MTQLTQVVKKHVFTVKENLLVKASIQSCFALSEKIQSFIYFHIISPVIYVLKCFQVVFFGVFS